MILPVLRIIAGWLAVATAAGMIAGCGGSGSESGASGQVSRAQALAFAHAVNLRPADIPKAKPKSFETTTAHAGSKPESAEFLCAPPSTRKHALGEVRSATFARTGGIANSAVRVLDSEAAATAAVAALAKQHALSCLPASEGTLRVSVSQLPATLPGGHPVAALRTTASATGASNGPHFYTDTYVFSAGPAEVALAVVSALKTPDVTTEQRLLALLYARALAHKLS
jgi:hypothetical protein